MLLETEEPIPTPENLASLEACFRRELASARQSADPEDLSRVRSSYFGPKGKVTLMARSVGRLEVERRPEAGRAVNDLKRTLESALGEVIDARAAEARRMELARERLDMTLPGRRTVPIGSAHPVNRVIDDIANIFVRMGFEIATGPEVEADRYNFEALNFPADHPARDMQDTFFVRTPNARDQGKIVLRTHTSPVQIRAMEKRGAPIRIISPGRVYRCDSDATHSPMFHQIEGLLVDEGVSMAHLKGVLQSFVNALFGKRPMRLRPSFFPFVEPGAEVDIRCVFCEGDGCRTCKQTGWMEILGAGMVHPRVLEACGIDSERYTGFAFGLGVDRVAMLRWRIDDLAHLFESDTRFLKQFE